MRNPKRASGRADPTTRYADMLAALGTDHRLRILRLLLAAHPGGMVAGDIQAEVGIPSSTLSHHLERLKAEGLVTVHREGTFQRYFANPAILEELLGFLFSECCSRSGAVKAETVIRLCRIPPRGRAR